MTVLFLKKIQCGLAFLAHPVNKTRVKYNGFTSSLPYIQQHFSFTSAVGKEQRLSSKYGRAIAHEASCACFPRSPKLRFHQLYYRSNRKQYNTRSCATCYGRRADDVSPNFIIRGLSGYSVHGGSAQYASRPCLEYKLLLCTSNRCPPFVFVYNKSSVIRKPLMHPSCFTKGFRIRKPVSPCTAYKMNTI